MVAFLAQTDGLAEKRGPILIQLAPSLAFDLALVALFFDLVRAVHDGPVVCEPRHATWFTPAVNALLTRYRIARVAADPLRAPTAMTPGRLRAVLKTTLDPTAAPASPQ